MAKPTYSERIFINVPFDPRYQRLFRALVFVIHDCGFVARCATEDDNSLQVRVDKLYEIIRTSKYSVHDISRLHARYNMPLELGIVLGAKRFGNARHKQKRALILDTEAYRYQRFCSDIAGQDIRAHENGVEGLIRSVRNWLRASPDTQGIILPSADFIYRRYRAFSRRLRGLCAAVNLDPEDLHFLDLRVLVTGWLSVNPR
ncbi:MAG: hypothetical protein AABO41_07900 [Acidobacteriota bacterium]